MEVGPMLPPTQNRTGAICVPAIANPLDLHQHALNFETRCPVLGPAPRCNRSKFALFDGDEGVVSTSSSLPIFPKSLEQDDAAST